MAEHFSKPFPTYSREQWNPCDVATGENSASSMQATTLGEDESMQ